MVLPALQKASYCVYWCKSPPLVLCAPPWERRRWREPKTTVVHNIPSELGILSRVIVRCPQSFGDQKQRQKVPKILRPEEELQVGSPVTMRVQTIMGAEVHCFAPVGVRGRIHATQLVDLEDLKGDCAKPLERIKKKDVVEGRLLSMQAKKKNSSQCTSCSSHADPR